MEEIENGAIEEDNEITQPGGKKYDTAEDARKDGSGKKMRAKPSFSDTDYDGSSGASTADKSKGAGYGEKPDTLPNA